ncbi:protein translocase subunit SecD [Candidatus Peribacteria bacterium]|nr:protein translocase subunit SecD [Candidatus Peribacteria bacterium]
MPKNRTLTWPLVTLVVGALALLIALPQEWKGWAPGFLSRPALHLGLDLAGGTQLDFRISEEEIRKQLDEVNTEITRLEKSGAPAEELNIARSQRQSIQDQQGNLVEAIRVVLERRINSLGVSEAIITPSYVGDERHILVECPGVVDVQECIKVVGKTIQLEFKEPFTEATADFTKGVRAKAQSTLRRITQSGSTLIKEGQDLGSQLGMAYQPSVTLFRDQLPKGLEGLWTTPTGRVALREGGAKQSVQNADGSIAEKEIPGVFLTEVLKGPTETGRVVTEATKAFALLAKTEKDATTVHHEKLPLDAKVDTRVAAALRSIQPGALKQVQTDAIGRVLFLNTFERGGDQVQASHILVSYIGAMGAGKEVTRTKEEALAKATKLRTQLGAGANFETIARTQSDGESSKDGGRLGSIGRGVMAPTFEQAVFVLKKPGDLTNPIETQFGYHIIRLDKAVSVSPDVATYDELVISPSTGSGQAAATEKRAGELATRLQTGNVKTTEQAMKIRMLLFSLEPSGWKDTQLDGKHFRAANVSLDSVTNIPVVQIAFDTEGARLFQELTKKHIGKQIAIFVGGELVSAPRVQQEISGGIAVITGSSDFNEAKQLAQDLNTGAIPAPIHLVGQYTVEATLGAAALQTSLMAALIGTIILMLYMILVYRVLGIMADIALTFYAVLLFAIMKLPLLFVSSNYIVLTLAGMSGIILSIGMAVDANVLVFERIKEELRKGKMTKTAIEASFKHSWPAIRDGNVATLITCGILFIAGTSIVRGFAVTLGMGTLLSLFSAVTITRWLLRRLAETPIANNPAAFGVKHIQQQ